MKSFAKFQERLEPEPLFVFNMIHCRSKAQALESAQLVTDKLKSNGRQSYAGVFQDLEQLKEYAEGLPWI